MATTEPVNLADAIADGAPPSERRRRRSDDPITALHYQLASARSQAALDAVVLVDESGCLVAGAGAWAVCEELAAFAPLLARPELVKHATVGGRVGALSSHALVRSVDVDGAEVLLCGRGGSMRRDEELSRAAEGCKRILRA